MNGDRERGVLNYAEQAVEDSERSAMIWTSSQLEKAVVTRKQSRLRRFKAAHPDIDPHVLEQAFQEGYHSGFGVALRRTKTKALGATPRRS